MDLETAAVNSNYKEVDRIIKSLIDGSGHYGICSLEEELENALNIISGKNCYDAMKLLIDNNVDINAFHNHAIEESSKSGDFKIVKLLVKNGAKISGRYSSPLMGAAENGYLEIVKYLINKGITNKKYVIDSAIVGAKSKGHEEIVEFLFKHGATQNVFDNHLLVEASKVGDYKKAKELILKGANILAWNNESLISASENGHIKTVKLLLKNGANINARKDMSLRIASENGFHDIVKYLLKKGANVHAEKDFAAFDAMMNGDYKMVEILLKNGCDLCLHNEEDIFVTVESIIEHGHYKLIKFLINKEKLNVGYLDGNLLAIALEHKEYKIAKIFLKNGIKIEEEGQENYEKPLVIAAVNCSYKIFKKLKSHYIKTKGDIRDISDELFISSALNDSAKIISSLIKDIKNKDETINEAFKDATYFGNKNTTEFLIACGADIKKQNYNAFKLAAENKHMDIIRIIGEVILKEHRQDMTGLFQFLDEEQKAMIKKLALTQNNQRKSESYQSDNRYSGL